MSAGYAGDPATVPPPDLSRHSVPLESIYFDTFSPVNRAVPLSRASPGLIEKLRDAIPPIHAPKYESASNASDWLVDDDVIIGYAVNESAWAYPVRILNYHEIVNDSLAGQPVLVAYCPLCGSGIVFSRRAAGRVLKFGNTSALYESDMVMFDYQTGSYWWHVAGRAIVGTLEGTRLQTLAGGITTSWREWRRLYPATRVLSRDTGHRRDYSRDPFVGYPQVLNRGRFAFPVSEAATDGRLPPATLVLAVAHRREARAYPVHEDWPRLMQDELGGEPLVVLAERRGSGGAVFSRRVHERVLSFALVDDEMVDRQTNSVWDLAGRAVRGPLSGQSLEQLPVKTSFWFAIVASVPDITIFPATE